MRRATPGGCFLRGNLTSQFPTIWPVIRQPDSNLDSLHADALVAAGIPKRRINRCHSSGHFTHLMPLTRIPCVTRVSCLPRVPCFARIACLPRVPMLRVVCPIPHTVLQAACNLRHRPSFYAAGVDPVDERAVQQLDFGTADNLSRWSVNVRQQIFNGDVFRKMDWVVDPGRESIEFTWDSNPFCKLTRPDPARFAEGV